MIESGRCGAVVFTAARIREQQGIAFAPYLLVLMSTDDDADEHVWCASLDGLRNLLDTAAPFYLNMRGADGEDCASLLAFLRRGSATH